jgi:CheY-like chemotaxis protein
MIARPVRNSILVADDEPGIRDLLLFTFEPLGYEVVVVQDGLEALRMVRARPFDLVILDVHMPNMGGPEALARIREHNPAQAVLVLSSGSDSNHSFERRLAAEGVFACLFKPVDLDELIGAVELALHNGMSQKS